MYTEKAERLELWVPLHCPEDPPRRRAPKMIAYGKWCQIHDLQYRRFSFGTRNQAWSLKSFCIAAAAAAKSPQPCLTLCDPIDGSPPDSLVPGILQARTLEWVAISFSNAWKWKVKVKSLSHVWLFVTPWTAAHQGPPSMGFSRQQYWSGLPLHSLLCSRVLLKYKKGQRKLLT